MNLNEIPVKFVQSYRNVLFLEQSTLQLPPTKSVESAISRIREFGHGSLTCVLFTLAKCYFRDAKRVSFTFLHVTCSLLL